MFASGFDIKNIISKVNKFNIIDIGIIENIAFFELFPLALMILLIATG